MENNTQKEEFLRLAVIQQKKYKDIAKKLDVEMTQLSKWWDELKPERDEINKVRQIWARKEFTTLKFPKFYDWFKKLDNRCYYCKITEEEIKALIDNGKIETKRLKTRGRRLELERRKPNKPYDDLKNLVLCCYWCNNAKTDEFTEAEFKEIGKVIGKIWKDRLKKLRGHLP